MTKHLKILSLTLSAISLLCCTKGDGLAFEGAVKYIRLHSSISGGGRALVDDNSAMLSGMGFAHVPLDAGDVVSFVGAVPFTGSRALDGEITFEAGKEPVYDLTGKVSHLLGYYPFAAMVDGVASWNVDGSTDILVSDPFVAGTYMDPVSRGMEFRHVLARVQVRCAVASGSSLEGVRQTWGQINSIQFREAPSAITLRYSDAKVVPGKVLKNLTLLNGEAYVGGVFTPVDIPGDGTAIVASAMVVPSGERSFVLIIRSQKQELTEVLITLSGGVSLSGGMVYTATLEFDDVDQSIRVASSTVQDWAPGGDLDGGQLQIPGPVLRHGQAPFDLMGDVGAGHTVNPYSDRYGSSSAPLWTNGPYQTSPEQAYSNEPPYHAIELANQDQTLGNDPSMTWHQAQGTALQRLEGDICGQARGASWRLPRISELRLIYENLALINATADDFEPLQGLYWSATEKEPGQAWSQNLPGGETAAQAKDQLRRVRCVKELPWGPILEYGVAPYSLTGYVEMVGKGCVTESYNGHYGESFVTLPGVPTNGAYRANQNEAFTGEGPYYRFEVALTDISNANGYPASMDWRTAQGKALGTGNDGGICTQTLGRSWRLPRISEARLIWENKAALEASNPDFQAFTGPYYWAATEKTPELGWYILMDSGLTGLNWKYATSLSRCVREVA